MAAQTRMKITRNIHRHAAALCLALLLLAAASRAADSPWSNIAGLIGSRRGTAVPTTSTAQGPAQPLPAAGTPAIPALAEVPLEGAATTALAMRTGSAASALAALSTTSATAAAAIGAALDGKNPELAKTLDLGHESEETEALLATNLFKKPDILRLLGNNPRFVYNPQERTDPMVVPWVRRAAIFKELSAQADKLMADKKFDQAVVLYQRILQLNDQRFTPIAHAKLVAIAEQQNAAALALLNSAKTAEPPVVLPPWVQDNTTGVIISRDRNMCLVGNYMLHIGDSVPDFPDVKVAAIAQSKVVYRIKAKTFEVSLKTD